MLKNYITYLAIIYVLSPSQIIFAKKDSSKNYKIENKISSILKQHGFTNPKITSKRVTAEHKNNNGKKSISVTYNISSPHNNFVNITADSEKHKEKKGESSYFESHHTSRINRKESITNDNEIYQHLNSILQDL